jgi:hypothetical protein
MIESEAYDKRGGVMSIIFYSDGLIKENRAYITKYLDEKRRNDPNFCIVDVGGGANPWYPRSNYIVDMNPVKGRDIICGDVNDSSTWKNILL